VAGDPERGPSLWGGSTLMSPGFNPAAAAERPSESFLADTERHAPAYASLSQYSFLDPRRVRSSRHSVGGDTRHFPLGSEGRLGSEGDWSPGASGTARNRQRGQLVIGACQVGRPVGRYVAGRAAPACEGHCRTPPMGHVQRRHRVLPFPRVGAEPNSPTGEQTGNVTEAGASLPSPSRRANVTPRGERDR
jgi:hypothetical protein